MADRVFNANLHENTFAFWAAKIVHAFAATRGIEQEDTDLWFDQLCEADKDGRFGFVSVPVVTTAVAV